MTPTSVRFVLAGAIRAPIGNRTFYPPPRPPSAPPPALALS